MYAYELTGELIDGGQEFVDSLQITQLPQLVSLFDTDWDGKKLDVDSDGNAVLNLGTQASEILSDIQIALFYCDTENDTMLYLGADNDIISDWDNGVFNDNFRGVWASLNGIPMYMELSYQGEDYHLYSSPILLNGEEYCLQFAYDFSAEEWVILGATQGIDVKTAWAARK